jgi:hypothetical protein
MKLILTLADQFETLANGKTLALGLYSDRIVIMVVPEELPPPTTESPYALDISVLVTVTDLPSEKMDAAIRIFEPNEAAPVREMRMPGLSVQAGESINVIFKLSPLLIRGSGVFKVEFEEASTTLTETFEARVRKEAVADQPRERESAVRSRKRLAPKAKKDSEA